MLVSKDLRFLFFNERGETQRGSNLARLLLLTVDGLSELLARQVDKLALAAATNFGARATVGFVRPALPFKLQICFSCASGMDRVRPAEVTQALGQT